MEKSVLDKIADVYILFLTDDWKTSEYIPENFHLMTNQEKDEYCMSAQIVLRRWLDVYMSSILCDWAWNVAHENVPLQKWVTNEIYENYENEKLIKKFISKHLLNVLQIYGINGK